MVGRAGCRGGTAPRSFHTYALLKRYADGLDDAGFLHPRILTEDAARAALTGPADAAHGALETAKPTPGGGLAVRGWAVLPSRGEPADAVVLGYRPTSGGPAAVGLVLEREVRWDVVSRLGRPGYYAAGWSAELPAGAVPAGSTVAAWAYDGATGRAYRLPDQTPDAASTRPN